MFYYCLWTKNDFSEEKIINSKETDVVGKFYYISLRDKKIIKYDLINIYLRSYDDNYEIYGISGGIFYDIIQDCKLKKNFNFFKIQKKETNKQIKLNFNW